MLLIIGQDDSKVHPLLTLVITLCCNILMVSPNKYSVEELLELVPDTHDRDPEMNAIAKGYRLAGRATWELYTKV